MPRRTAEPCLARKVHVRIAVAADCGAIAQLLAKSFHEFRHNYTDAAFSATVLTPREIMNRLSDGPIWVAIHDADVIGTISAVQKSNTLHVRSLAVLPSWRGQGIGELLMKTVEEHARDLSVRRILLSTTPFLTAALALYQRCGFEIVPEGPNDLCGTPLVGMAKAL